MAQALYREWRPQTFDDVVEQEHVISALKQAVISNELGHAYLFTGTRGTGKTTMAKILSRAVNCLHPHDGNPDNSCDICQSIMNNTLTDVAEIDAASHNSVDNIRQITEEIVFSPARARYKVYIIDEVHMLSTGAFNALLKTLEEPPAHAIFILATTEPHRLPVTVLSRCQRYDFKRISESSIAGRLDLIASNEQIKIEPAAIRTIALLADGALRDAISLLDQAKISFPHGASEADIRQMSGQVDRQFMIRLIQGIIQSDVIQILQMLDQMIRDGQDIVRFTHSLASFYRDLLIIHAAGDTTALQSSSLGGLIHASDAEINQMKGLAAHYQQPEVVSRITQLSNLISDLRWSPNPRTLLEVGIMRLIGTRAAEIVAKQSAPVQQVAPIQQAPVQQVAPVQQATPVQQVAPVQQPTVKKEVQAAPQAVTPPQASPVHDDYPYPDEPYMDYDDYPHKEVVQSNQPTNAAVPEVAAPAKQVAPEREAETVPETVQAQASPVESQHAVTSAREAADVWAKILNAMQKQDMFCYLFAKEAKIEAGDGGLVVVFAEEEKAHYNVFSGDRGIKTLREAMRSALGHMLPYRVSLEGSEDGQAFSENQNDTRSWQDPIARAADSLGIPIERKD